MIQFTTDLISVQEVLIERIFQKKEPQARLFFVIF